MCIKEQYFEHDLSFLKQLRETAIGTKMALPYAIIFLGDLEERFYKTVNLNH